MITAGRLHECWRALPFGSLDDVIGDGTHLSDGSVPLSQLLAGFPVAVLER